MVETATLINPLAAPEPKAFARKSVAKCVRNEVGDMPLQLKERSNVAADEFVPFWTIEFEALDARWNDGNPIMRRFGSKLVDKNGSPLDNTQRPAVAAQAFAGLGIIAYPEDPNYDESAVVGVVFEVEEISFDTGKPVYVPTVVLGPDFVYEGDVYVAPAKADSGAPVVQLGGSAQTTEIIGNPVLEEQLAVLLGVGDDKAAIRMSLSGANFGAGLTLNGFGVNGLAVAGKLYSTAVEAGLVN